MDALIQARDEFQLIAIARGIPYKLSYMPFIIKATSLCLTKFPLINSSIDSNLENLIVKVRIFYK